MDKVYVVVELYTFESATDYRITTYAEKNRAYADFRNKVKRELTDSWIKSRRKDELVMEYNTEKMEFDCYIDGMASEFETTICVLEKEIL